MSNGINNLVEFDKFTIDTEKKVLWCEDEPVNLPMKAVELLCVLIENNGEVVSKEDLLNEVWQESFVEEGILSQNIYQLRQVFKKHGINTDLIQTIPRRGYRFTGQVSEIFEEEISIERSSIEKSFVSESYTSDDEKDLNKRPKQFPAISKSFTIGNKSLIFVIITLVSLITIGATIWFWKPSDTGNKSSKSKPKFSPELVTFSHLTDSGKAFFPAISRDNQNLAYVRLENEKWSIILQHLSTGSETVIVEPQEYELRSINFSADGNHIFYAARERETPESTIYQIPIYGGSKRKILTQVRHHISISRDGKKFAFFRYIPKEKKSCLMMSNIDGTNEKIITTRKPREYFQVWGTYPDWSPDDKKIVVTGVDKSSPEENKWEKENLLEIDVATGEETIVKTPGWKTPFQAFWLNDESGFVVSVQEESKQIRQLWHLERESGRATRITNDTNHYYEFRPSFDGESLILMSRKNPSNIYLIDLENPTSIEQITQGNTLANGRYGLTWSKDGKNLLFVKSDGFTNAEIWKVNVETKALEQITFDKGKSIIKIEMMPAGESMLFSSDRAGNWHIWQIGLDGRNLKKFLKKGSVTLPEITSDGKWLLYRDRNNTPNEYRKMPLFGGKSEVILKSDSGSIKASPTDPKMILAGYYDPKDESERWKVALFSIAEKDTEKDLKFFSFRSGFEWSADGKGFYFPKLNTLWYLSVADNKTREITALKDLRIFSLSISPNGKTLAVSGENRTSNILKISRLSQN